MKDKDSGMSGKDPWEYIRKAMEKADELAKDINEMAKDKEDNWNIKVRTAITLLEDEMNGK